MRTERTITLRQTPYLEYATVYTDPSVQQKACILYFHGGGLLYGSRMDLPSLHLDTITQTGFTIIAFDYPLAPAAKLDLILNDVIASINQYLSHPDTFAVQALPYFLWGRSAGAYLCLIALASKKLLSPPMGILSYYGYGFLCDRWYETPNRYYCTLPPVNAACLQTVTQKIHTEGALDTHYSIYVYARQSGHWKSLLYNGREKYFLLDYSLRGCDKLPCPLFCAHSMNDTDVPFSEFTALSQKYHAERFIASGSIHDFDRDETNPFTVKLLERTLHFARQQLS